MMPREYPDISYLLKAKDARRRRLAQLSFEEKIAIAKKWRDVSKEIAKVRQQILESSQSIAN